MSQRVEEIEVDVVLTVDYQGRNGDAIQQLKDHGMVVEDVDDADGVVEGTIRAELLASLRQLPCVAYLRQLFRYEAQQP